MQESLKQVPHSVLQEQLRAFESLTPDQRRSLAERAADVSPELLTSQAEEYAKNAKWQSIKEAETLKAEGNALHATRQFLAAAAKYRLAIQSLSQACEWS